MKNPRVLSMWQLPALAAAVVVFLALMWRHDSFVTDETFVTLVCGRNLGEGQGLVFVTGGAGPVCPSPVYSGIAALLATWGIDPLRGLGWVTLIAVGLLVVAVQSLLRVTFNGGGLGIAAILILLPTAALAYWAFAPGDVVLAAALVTAATAAVLAEMGEGRWRAAGGLFVAAMLLRPEIALPFAALILVSPRSHGALRPSGPDIAMVAAAALLLLFGRWAYYGVPLFGSQLDPTISLGTIAAGIDQLLAWLRADPLLAAMLAWPLFQLILMRRADAGVVGRLRVIYLVMLAYVAGVVLSGGDSRPYHAAFVPILPLAALLVVSVPRLTALGAPALLVIAAAHAGWSLLAGVDPRVVAAEQRITAASQIAPIVAEEIGEQKVAATDMPGALAYFSHRRVIGLAPGEVAAPSTEALPPPRDHAEAALAWQPDLILFGVDHSGAPRSDGARQLEQRPLFRFFYRQRQEPKADAVTDEYAIESYVFESRDAELWQLAWEIRGDVPKLVDRLVERFTASPVTPAPLTAEIEERLAEVDRLVEAKDYAAARAIMDELMRRPGHPASKVAGMAGLAALFTGDLHGAALGFKDALRAQPEDIMLQRHLRTFLRAGPEVLTPGPTPIPTPTLPEIR